jgi:type I restriction enzyme S subunit
MSWPLRPVSELCEFATDCVNKTATVVDYETPYKMIRTTNVKAGFIDTDNVRYVTKDTFEKWTRRSRPRFGDVILTREAPVGEVGRCTFGDEQNIFLGQRLFQFRPNPELLDWNFLAYVLQSPSVQGRLHGMSFGATVPHIKVGDAESLLVPCPSLEEQRKIGGVLAVYDDLIATNQRRIQLLEDAVRRLYREWFAHLRFPGYESVPIRDGVPEGWRKVPLGDLAHLNYGKALKASERKDGQVPVYGSSGVVGHHDRAIVDAGAIIVGRKGNVGSLYFSQVPCFPIDTVFFISPDQASYLLFLALHQLTFNSSDAAVPGLNRSYAISLPITWPDTATRERFEAHASPLFKQIRTLTDANIELAKARDLLLPKLMSGQLDVSRITHKEVPI